MGFAAVARVTDTRWITCSVKDDINFGLHPGDELEVATTICHEIRQSGEPVIIDHVREDALYREHPTAAMYGFQSYISMPIVRRDGSFFGTLCAIDPNPAQVSRPEIVGMFRLFADLIAFHLDAYERLIVKEADLAREREAGVLREQFIAVLGHDLRNPLTAISSGVRLLARNPPPERAARVLGLMQGSVERMVGLIDNVLDFARGRLGGGIKAIRQNVDLTTVLVQVIDELRTSHPDRTIDASIHLPATVSCDAMRLAQLFSNLLGNAIMHGASDQPISIDATAHPQTLDISVSNSGAQVPAAMLKRLFEPFERGRFGSDQGGLGLGLYIAAQIADAHGGTLTATSTPDVTCFTFSMPLQTN